MDTNNNQQQIKVVNVDPRSKKRVRFQSSKQRAKRATADIYRTFHRSTVGGTIAPSATRENIVHNETIIDEPVTKKVKRGPSQQADDDDDDPLQYDLSITTFGNELDITKERNSSQLFSKLYKELSPLVHSLPEILHHLSDIVSILLEHVLSPSSSPTTEDTTTPTITLHERQLVVSYHPLTQKDTRFFVTNLVTSDVLHLLAVLGKDVKGEIHPYLFQSILPRIIYHLIQPPPTHLLRGGGGVTLNVSIVEAAFRCLSYLFKYNNNTKIISQGGVNDHHSEHVHTCMDTVRQFYGSTLGHTQEFVRRLAAETFAPWIRKVLISDAARIRHVRKVIQALCISSYTATKGSASSSSSSSSSEAIAIKSHVLPQDAIHGVSLLLFYLCKGVEGKLHSKTSKGILTFVLEYILGSGAYPLKDDNEKEEDKRQGNFKERIQHDLQIYISIATQFFHHIQNHLQGWISFQPVWENLVESIHTTIHHITNSSNTNQQQHPPSSLLLHSFHNKLVIFHQCILYGQGALLRHPSSSSYTETDIPWMYPILTCLLDTQLYFMVSPSIQQQILIIVSSMWKTFGSQDMTLSLHLCGLISPILDITTGIKSQSYDSTLFLIDELLPSLPHSLGVKYLVPMLLSSIVRRMDNGDNNSINGTSPPWKLLYSIVSLYSNGDDGSDSSTNIKSYNLFCASIARDCEIPMNEKVNLIHMVLEDLDGKKIGNFARILPFLAHIQPQERDDPIQEQNEQVLRRILSWYTHSIERFWKEFMEISPSSSLHDGTDKKSLITSMLLGGLSATILECKNPSRPYPLLTKLDKKIRKCLEQARVIACHVINENASSPITVVCIANFVQALSSFSMQLSNSPDQVFERLTLNLRSPNPFLRKYSLSVLNSYPKKAFVTNFADLDTHGELDDEHDFSRPKDEESSRLNHGSCDLIETLVQIESYSPTLDNERQFLSAISKVEILGRSGRLPIQYSEVAIHHMFGILHVKFQPLWSAVVRAIVALIATQEKVVWPCVESMLFDTMYPQGEIVRNNHDSISCTDDQLNLPRMHYTGTDKDTLFDTIWSITYKIPLIISRKARIIVPIFINFLSRQYFVYHDDDPDSREIDWNLCQDSTHTFIDWTKDQLTSKTIQKKLISFLSMFRELKGLIHLYQSDLLLFIFISFLSNPDMAIAKLSFDCIMKFKLPYVCPYADSLKLMLTKGELRETLTKINAYSTTDDFVDSSHRQHFFPVIIRLLFGRLIARGSNSRSKSSNSADARRSAILSFIAMIAKNNYEGDFDYFIYLMIRAFIPKSIDMTLVNNGHANRDRIRSLIKVCLDIDASAIARIPTSRLEGFLNLLSTVIKQCALCIQGYVDVFLFLCLKIIQYTEMHRIKITHDVSPKHECLMLENQDIYRAKVGVLRNSSFRRMQELLDRFKITFDTEHVEFLWVTLKPSIVTLPGMVVNAINPPSILKLIECCSIHPVLVRYLHSQVDIVRSVIMCISNTSTSKIMDAVLRILENFFDECGSLSTGSTSMNNLDLTGGVKLVQYHIPLLLDQFAERLRRNDYVYENKRPTYRKKHDNVSDKKELMILRRISELISLHEDYNESSSDTLNTLCRVLVPHLQNDPENQSDVTNILVNFAPRVNAHTASFLFSSLARLLGPSKTRAGLTDKAMRLDIVRVIGAISLRDDATSAMKKVVLSLNSMSAISKRNVDEFDFDQVLPAINKLGQDSGLGSWSTFLEAENLMNSTKDGLSSILPLLYTCLHLLYDPDGVITRGCVQALKALINLLSRGSDDCIEFARTIIIPCIRTGLKTDIQGARKHYIQLIYEISRKFSSYSSIHFHGDLNSLINENEPDLDFFLNYVHVQMHRRTRAFVRLRKILNAQNESTLEEQQSTCHLSTSTIVQILLPLLMHSIHEASSKEDENHALEAISTIGVLARKLPLGKYQRFLWSTILQIHRHPSKERYLLTLISTLLDAFHFHVDHLLWDHNTQIEVCVQTANFPKARSELAFLKSKIIPKIEAHLVKKCTTGSNRSSIVRCQLLTSLTKLFEKLSERLLESKFPHLLGLLCDALKNRESDERDQARIALTRLTASLDMKYIPVILRELSITLTEGYQLHVRAACLHSILVSLVETHRGRESNNEEDILRFHFDNSLPAMMVRFILLWLWSKGIQWWIV